MSIVLRRCTLLLLALVTAGCGLGTTPPPDPFGGPQGQGGLSDQIHIIARSQNPEDVVLYALSSQGTERLGRLDRSNQEVFRLPWSDVGELRIRVEILAGPRHTTNALSVQPGDRVELWVQPDAEDSFIRRR